MTIQITVRIPDDDVAFLDQQVAAGAVSSRAAGVSAALRRARRQAMYNEEIKILIAANGDPYPDLGAFAEQVSQTAFADLD